MTKGLVKSGALIVGRKFSTEKITMKKVLISAGLASLVMVANAQVAADNAGDAVYVVGAEYIQVGTPPGDQTGATNGLNGGFGFNKWQRGGYGTPPNNGTTLITNISSAFNMGSKQFSMRSGPGGVEGADARRRALADLVYGQTMSFSIMPGGNGAGDLNTKGDFGVEIRSASLSNPGRDMISINGSNDLVGKRYSLLDYDGYQFSSVLVNPGERVDITVTQITGDDICVTMKPFGGALSSYLLRSVSTGVLMRTAQFYCFETSGDFYFNNLQIGGLPHNVTGTVNLTDFPHGTAEGESVEFQLIDGAGVAVETLKMKLGAGGAFAFPTARTGSYKIAAKGRTWLREVSGAVTITASGGSIATPISLINGDCDGSNYINTDDYLILSDSFDLSSGDTGFVKAADLDGNDLVNTDDYLILSDNFDIYGYEPN